MTQHAVSSEIRGVNFLTQRAVSTQIGSVNITSVASQLQILLDHLLQLLGPDGGTCVVYIYLAGILHISNAAVKKCMHDPSASAHVKRAARVASCMDGDALFFTTEALIRQKA